MSASRNVSEIDIIVLFTAVQVIHLVQIAEQMGLKDDLLTAMRRTVILSIGPSTSEELHAIGIQPDYEPSHPKMGILIHEAAGRAQDLLQQKRARL